MTRAKTTAPIQNTIQNNPSIRSALGPDGSNVVRGESTSMSEHDASRRATPMLFAIGFVAMFTIGGISGVTHAVVPSDWQQTDTYYIVAHLHYVLFGGSVFGLFAGMYYWYPKLTGKVMNSRLGKVHFWIMFIAGRIRM